MLKQLIFTVMCLFFVGHVQGKALEKQILLSPVQFEVQKEAIALMDSPIPLFNMWANLAAIVDIDGDSRTYLDVFQMIQGKMAGVQVSGSVNSYKVRLRNSSCPPLFVIDGTPLMGYNDADINNLVLSILPTEVESIEITRGIRGSLIYGAAARNGLVEIQTLPNEEDEEIE